MPYVKVPEAELVVGQDYVLTHIGCESRMAGEAKWVEKPNPDTFLRTYRPTVVAPECVILDNIQPGCTGTLEKAYKTWLGIRNETPGAFTLGWVNPAKRKGDATKVVAETEYRKRAFYAGLNKRNSHVFTQERSFGSKKATAFIPVDPKGLKPKLSWSGKPIPGQTEDAYPFGTSLAPEGEWVVWREVKGNAPETCLAAAEPAAVAAPVYAPTGNLLGLNNIPKMTNANNALRKDREIWEKTKKLEEALKGGARSRKGKSGKGKSKTLRKSRI